MTDLKCWCQAEVPFQKLFEMREDGNHREVGGFGKGPRGLVFITDRFGATPEMWWQVDPSMDQAASSSSSSSAASAEEYSDQVIKKNGWVDDFMWFHAI